MIKERLVGENKKYRFYQNFLCIKKYKGYRILLAENKITKQRTYLVIENNKPIYENNRIEDIYCHIDMLKLSDKK